MREVSGERGVGALSRFGEGGEGRGSLSAAAAGRGEGRRWNLVRGGEECLKFPKWLNLEPRYDPFGRAWSRGGREAPRGRLFPVRKTSLERCQTRKAGRGGARGWGARADGGRGS